VRNRKESFLDLGGRGREPRNRKDLGEILAGVFDSVSLAVPRT
jgi:hypothetical protein